MNPTTPSGESSGKKTGIPNINDYEGDDYHLQSLEALSAQLQKDIPEARMDPKAIAQFQTGLLHFLEDALGVKSLPPRPFPKLPTHLIEDTRPNGTLHTIILKVLQMKDAKGIKKLEWRNPQLRTQLLTIIDSIRSLLIKEEKVVVPMVYFHPSCGKDELGQAADAVRQLKGRVATHPSEQGITHWVFPFGPNGDPDDGQEYMRTQKRRGAKSFVHWWYLPDSYNEWIDANVAPSALEVDTNHVLRGPAKVYIRWVLDSKKYNEWMNAIDYETEAGVDDHDKYKQDLAARGITPADAARKRDTSGLVLLPNAAKVMVLSQEVDPNVADRVSEGLVRRKLVTPYRRAMDGSAASENLSQGQLLRMADGSSATLAMASVQPEQLRSDAGAAAPPLPPREGEAAAPAEVAVPTYALWFRFESVHTIERCGNVEFFNGLSASKTEATYMEYRNFMVRAYRRDPRRKLTFLACRSQLVGDVTAIFRVWTFLEAWGLINFEAAQTRRFDEPVEVVRVDNGGGEVRVIRPQPSHLPAPSLDDVSALPRVTPADAVAAAAAGRHHMATAAKKEPYNKTFKELTGGRQEYFCSAMPSVNCTDVRYHCTKYPEINLCPQAFAEGRFPSGTAARDFERIEKSSAMVDATGWSEQETLLLLEGLEMYGDKWAEVADHVSTKNQVDCVLHFLQLPIEEDLIADLETATAPEPKADGGAVEPPDQHLAFANAGNPVMAELSFLAEIIGPRVASDAAAAALEALWTTAVDPDGAASQNVAANEQAVPPADGPALTDPIPDEKLRESGAAALAAAAVKAKLLADQEERRMHQLVLQAIEAQARKLTLKFEFLKELESTLEGEHGALVAARTVATAERSALAQQRAALTPAEKAQLERLALQRQQEIAAQHAAQQAAAAAAATAAAQRAAAAAAAPQAQQAQHAAYHAAMQAQMAARGAAVRPGVQLHAAVRPQGAVPGTTPVSAAMTPAALQQLQQQQQQYQAYQRQVQAYQAAQLQQQQLLAARAAAAAPAAAAQQPRQQQRAAPQRAAPQPAAPPPTTTLTPAQFWGMPAVSPMQPGAQPPPGVEGVKNPLGR